MEHFLSQLKYIRHIILDVDGVLTSGDLLITEKGEHLRTMYIRDGFAMKHAIDKGFSISVISGGSSKGVKKRLLRLGISEYYENISDKKKVLGKHLRHYKIKPDTLLYMGDDIPDVAPLTLSGFPCCPADACEEVKAVSKYISPFNGGRGCVRDILEKTMKVQNCWE